MPHIVRTPRAKADVLSIGRYIAQQSGSRSAALRFLDKIYRPSEDGIDVLRILLPRVKAQVTDSQ